MYIDSILIINSGSSSIKFSVYEAESKDFLLYGIVDGINTSNCFVCVKGHEKIKLKQNTYEGGMQAVIVELKKFGLFDRISLLGHRVAHGGSAFNKSVLINDKVLKKIDKVCCLAPLHNPVNLTCINLAERYFPNARHVAVFDTSFHQTLKPEAYLYGLPIKYYNDLGVRRYGFHGTSHRYVARKAYELLSLKELDSGLIIAHLGNGASICAINNGISVDTSMGMTPLEGVMMGTRCGDVDFGAMAWIAKETGKTIEELERIANTESGLLGISNISSDMRVLEKSYQVNNALAKLAINTYVHKIARHIGGHITSLNRLDAIIFTGGVGENSVLIRKLILDRLRVFGVIPDYTLNSDTRSGTKIVSSIRSRVMCAVIPTDEEEMIAFDTINIGKRIKE